MTGDAPGTLFASDDLACWRGERLIFTGLSFALEAGGALVVRGPNASGKSSLLRLLCGLLRPAAGWINWGGAPISDDPDAHHARLHYVGHLDGVNAPLTVAENVRFWAGLRGGRGEPSAALGRLGLVGLAPVPARYLSAGQRRRLALARLVATPAALWLLDEPTVTLDDEATGVLEALIAEHREGGGVVVLATHGSLALEGAQTIQMERYAPAADGLP